MDVQTLIDKAGGVGKLAFDAGVSHSTVCDWKRIGYIPPTRIGHLSDRLGLTAEDTVALVKLAARQPDGEAPSAPDEAA